MGAFELIGKPYSLVTIVEKLRVGNEVGPCVPCLLAAHVGAARAVEAEGKKSRSDFL
jgi:hypothetical protein